jgi:adenylate cyclase
MNNEIERKFLVKDTPPGLDGYNASDISQGYLAVTDDGTEVRLRKIGDRYFETVKSGKGLERKEAEAEIGIEAFNTLWPLTAERRLEKTRYDIPYGGHVIELDVYLGDLAGLVVAEVEFNSVDDSGHFNPPSWFGGEVTNDSRYKNRNLALYGRPED